MHLNKKEGRIVASLLFASLSEKYAELVKDFDSETKLPAKIKEEMEIQKNLFRRLKKELRITLTEEDAIRIGLIEEVSSETLKKYADKAAGVPRWRLFGLPLRVRFFTEGKAP